MSRIVMIYVQHLLGIGHLMRARSIAGALAKAGFEVHLVSGGMPSDLRVPASVHALQLPPVYAADASLHPLRDASGGAIDETFRERRRDLLLSAFASISPDVVVVETYPFGRRGLRFELVPLMERIESTTPRPRVVSSVRDMIQVRTRTEREREMLDAANRWFDAILIHGDPRFARFEQTFRSASELWPPVRYTGFVHARPGAIAEAQVGPRHEIVVSAGGGAVGMDLLRAAIAARALSQLGDRQWRILVGTNVGDGDFRRLAQEAGPTIIVERARNDFAELLRGALVSVSQAGYNTVLDVCTSGAAAVFVPFTGSGETEQRMRADRLRELGLGRVVDDAALTPVALAAAIDAAGRQGDSGHWDFASDGATRTAEMIAEMVR